MMGTYITDKSLAQSRLQVSRKIHSQSVLQYSDSVQDFYPTEPKKTIELLREYHRNNGVFKVNKVSFNNRAWSVAESPELSDTKYLVCNKRFEGLLGNL